MKEKKWKRNCPKCDRAIYHAKKEMRDYFVRHGMLCVSCSKLGRIPWNKGKNHGKLTKKKMSEWHTKNNIWKGRTHTEETKKKMSQAKIGISRSENTKKKIRLSYLEKIKEKKLNGGQLIPNYNRLACEYFDWLNKWKGWNGKHAMDGGELFLDKLGFWVDYYEPALNLVVEWDEKKHYTTNGVLKKKDIQRMRNIKKLLGCRFFRVNDKTKELKEW